MHERIFLRLTLLVVLSAVASTSLAHHGFGRFQMNIESEWSGTLTKVELVNPHTYMYFDSIDANGNVQPMRCEMRAASMLRRMGWSADLFVPGAYVEVQGNPHGDDPGACFLADFTLNETVEVNRYETLSSGNLDVSDRPLRLTSGEPNISGSWAIEQTLRATPPSGGEEVRVPASYREAFIRGEITFEEIRTLNPFPYHSTPVYTAAGRALANAYDRDSVEDNPQLSCRPTSIVIDWTDGWPINSINQATMARGDKIIDMGYGLITTSRRIHMDMGSHPANLEPSNSGHSIGHWEGDTLIVDTVGFAAGMLVPPTPNSEQLHVVERFALNTENFSLHRDWTATDPVYLEEPFEGADLLLLSDVSYVEQPCLELTPEFLQE